MGTGFGFFKLARRPTGLLIPTFGGTGRGIGVGRLAMVRRIYSFRRLLRDIYSITPLAGQHPVLSKC